MSATPAGRGPADPYAPFRPVRGRAVALVAGAVTLLLFVVIALLVPGGDGGFGIIDRLLLVGCGAGIAGLLARYAAIVAVPSPQGIHVRNLFVSRDVAWSEIEQVQLRHGDPWPALLLHDTDQVAVMGIQRADGLRSRTEVGRLVALVEHHQGGVDTPWHPDFDLPL